MKNNISFKKMPLKDQLAILDDGHPVNLEYLAEKIKQMTNIELEKYLRIKGDVHRTSYTNICSALGRSTTPGQNGKFTLGEAIKELWSLIADDTIPDRHFEDREDEYCAVFSISAPIAWRRNFVRKTYPLK